MPKLDKEWHQCPMCLSSFTFDKLLRHVRRKHGNVGNDEAEWLEYTDRLDEAQSHGTVIVSCIIPKSQYIFTGLVS
ncbi:unnamed protein product [Strongylus vulgaris]|uniref:Uncharacterized protein n=1 Tax=Strongylus vulgaris TaxID=40348 RepID=A0A3P7JGY1_STRVU|nr:unnamed protein product [Strongylus vulgaris]